MEGNVWGFSRTNSYKEQFFFLLYQQLKNFLLLLIMRLFLLEFGLVCFFGYGYSWNLRIPDFIESFLGIESCNSYWLQNDLEGFRGDLRNIVFGQPFLVNALEPLLRFHFEEGSKPSKPLTLSFHGSPGTGKTFVAQIIGDHFFRKGRESKFYKHFTMADVYSVTQDELINQIKQSVQKCPRMLFVFDEIEKMPDGTFEAIKSFLDYYHSVSDIDFRRSTFIFISNIGMDKINSLSKKLWDNGIQREEFKLSEFEQQLLEITYEADGGLKGTRIVKNFLIDLYLPFLPLEKKHVEQCIRVVEHDISPENVKKVIDELVFVPPNAPIYSLSGCKAVENLARRLHRYSRDEL